LFFACEIRSQAASREKSPSNAPVRAWFIASELPDFHVLHKSTIGLKLY
jgi:hypothetical protein